MDGNAGKVGLLKTTGFFGSKRFCVLSDHNFVAYESDACKTVKLSVSVCGAKVSSADDKLTIVPEGRGLINLKAPSARAAQAWAAKIAEAALLPSAASTPPQPEATVPASNASEVPTAVRLPEPAAADLDALSAIVGRLGVLGQRSGGGTAPDPAAGGTAGSPLQRLEVLVEQAEKSAALLEMGH